MIWEFIIGFIVVKKLFYSEHKCLRVRLIGRDAELCYRLEHGCTQGLLVQARFPWRFIDGTTVQIFEGTFST